MDDNAVISVFLALVATVIVGIAAMATHSQMVGAALEACVQ
jgi:hypothetical protein